MKKKIWLLPLFLSVFSIVQGQIPSNKREIMEHFLSGKLDKSYIPGAFFMHFPQDSKSGEKAINAHVEYFLATGMDFVKIQFEQGYGRIKIEKTEDWKQIKPLPSDFFQPTLNIVKGIYDRTGAKVMVLSTVYSPFQMLIQTVGVKTVVEYATKNPDRIKEALRVFTEGIKEYVKSCKAIGIDGFYTPTQGGEMKFYSIPRFFEDFVKPYDLEVINECNKGTRLNILHICDYEGTYDDLSRYLDYPGQIINAPVTLNGKPLSLEKCEQIFKRPVMGGLYRKGAILNGTPNEVATEVKKLAKSNSSRFILGADCTVLPDTPMVNIQTAIKTAHGSE